MRGPNERYVRIRSIAHPPLRPLQGSLTFRAQPRCAIQASMLDTGRAISTTP